MMKMSFTAPVFVPNPPSRGLISSLWWILLWTGVVQHKVNVSLWQRVATVRSAFICCSCVKATGGQEPKYSTDKKTNKHIWRSAHISSATSHGRYYYQLHAEAAVKNNPQKVDQTSLTTPTDIWLTSSRDMRHHTSESYWATTER